MIVLDRLGRWYPTIRGRHWVLRDISLTIPAGANVGIFGPNGAGKSTLLRLIGGIDSPSTGAVRIAGSVSWPLGLAGGYQGSMTGRENARFVARVYGLDAAAADRVCDFAHEFSELGDQFHLPVRTYSSGMRSRLSFAVSMAFAFDYYIIDELTAVGDAAFRAKSHAALKARKRTSQFVMVSHNVGELVKEVDVGLFVHGGTVRLFQDPSQALLAYREACGP
jgi:capsular polysaccharide transport system ATP-binding protein